MRLYEFEQEFMAFSSLKIGRETGCNPGTLRSWVQGQRRPSPSIVADCSEYIFNYFKDQYPEEFTQDRAVTLLAFWILVQRQRRENNARD